MSSVSDLSSMASSLQQSIEAAIKRVQTQSAGTSSDPDPATVKQYEQDTKKSSLNISAMGTDIGVLTKDKSRLNVMSMLGKNDPVDFYRVKVTSTGTVSLGQVGDQGVRFQLMDKSGSIVADSDSTQGKAYDAYKKMKEGTYELAGGSYTVRISRDKGVSTTEQKNYAFQLRQGTYTEDYDTIARQPSANDRPFDLPSYLTLLNGGSTDTTGGLASILMAGNTRGRLVNSLF